MVRKTLLLLGAAALAFSASAQTVDEIIAKNIQARGGMDKLKAVQSIRYTGKLAVGPGLEAPITLVLKRPTNMRMELTVQGLTAIQAYDGKTGWQIVPFEGKKDPELMSEENLKDAVDQSDIDGPLVDYAQKGHKVELIAKEPVEGTDAYKLKVTLKTGGILFLYIDADSFLEIKTERKRTVRGTEREVESVLGDYKEVKGLMIPHSIEAGAKDSPQKQKITIEAVEINPSVEDARFKMPEVSKPEPKPEEKKPRQGKF
jgi:outer membrane lipoprotein-sorting protein